MNRLNITMLGDFFADTSFVLSLSNEKDTEKLMYCVFSEGRYACRVNLCFVPNLNTDENCIFVESIELTSANQTQSEKILNELIDESRIPQILEQLKEQRYSKVAQLNSYVETERLKSFLFNDEFSPNINEITICFKINEKIYDEISEKGFESIGFRSVYDNVYYGQGCTIIGTENIAQLHYAMQRADVFIITDTPFYSNFTEEQLELLKPYIKSVPVAAFNSDSELLIDMVEDIDVLEREDMEIIKKIKCRNTNRLLKRIGVGNAFFDDDGKILTIGTTSGDDGDITLYDAFVAYSLGMIADKLQDWYSYNTKVELPFSVVNISKITELADDKNAVVEFLKSDKPLIHANGGITIKNHGKYKFKESCVLAAGLYKYLDAVIDEADISEADKFHLHSRLLHNLDSYAFFDGQKMLNREKFVEAAEKVRESKSENAIYELARYAMEYLK